MPRNDTIELVTHPPFVMRWYKYCWLGSFIFFPVVCYWLYVPMAEDAGAEAAIAVGVIGAIIMLGGPYMFDSVIATMTRRGDKLTITTMAPFAKPREFSVDDVQDVVHRRDYHAYSDYLSIKLGGRYTTVNIYVDKDNCDVDAVKSLDPSRR